MIPREVQMAIQEASSVGMTIKETKAKLREMNLPVPDSKSIRKYYNKKETDEPAVPAQKKKAFDEEPFRTCIIEIMRNNKSPCASSIYDVLYEKYVIGGKYDCLPASERSLRRYVVFLRESWIVEQTPKNGRVYDHVFDTPPGEQMLIDFGDFNLGNRKHFYFICLLLRYSRFLVVFGQDHKFNSADACRAIYKSFLKLGGRPKCLVIDQDAVFINTETFGEVIKTDTFDGFCREQQLELFVCRKGDPESKGPIENSVSYVKKRYMSARSDLTADELIRGLPGWLQRANRRIHRATFCVPEKIYNEIEKPAMRPLLPSVYNNSPRSFIPVELTNYPYISYKSCKYYYPSDYAFHDVLYRVVDNTIYLYDAKRVLVTTYPVSAIRGRSFQHEGYAKKPIEWLKTVEKMRSRWDGPDFQHFVNGVKKEAKGRYMNERFAEIYRFLDSRNPNKKDVDRLFDYCCKNFRYAPSQVRTSWELLEKDPTLMEAISQGEAPHAASRDLSVYQAVFDQLSGKDGE